MKVEIGDATLYLGDCMEILPTLDKVDAVITDPPYGIGEAKKQGTSRSRPTAKWHNPTASKYESSGWDDATVDYKIIEALIEKSDCAVIWGGNYYPLPPSSCWFVWDKKTSGDFADCELAWTNLPKAVRRIEWLWSGFKKQTPEQRYHPTQKPLQVMVWCIEQAGNPKTILDPFMGSGTTGVAAIQLGRKFIGIEREPKYFDIACERIEAASKQVDMFIEQPKQEQESMF